jgi:chromosome segregation ATPase
MKGVMMQRLKGFDIRRLARLGIVLAAVSFLVCGCGEQLTRIEENQAQLQAMIAANARQIADLSAQVHTGHEQLTGSLDNLDSDARGITIAVETVQDQQRRLHETVVAGNQSLDTRATQLREGQQAIQGRVAQVQDVAQRTSSDLTSLSQEHTALHETVRTNQRELNERIGVVVSNQQDIRGGVTRLHEAGEGLSRDIASVAGRQETLAGTIEDNHRQAAERFAALLTGQDRLATDILNVQALVQTVGADVTAVADQQTATQAALQTSAQALGDKLVVLERNQKNQQSVAERTALTVNETAAAIAAIAAAQTAMQESLGTNHGQLTAQIAGLAEGQQHLRGGIGSLDAKVDQAASDSAAASASLHETIRISREVLTGQMAAGLQNQHEIQTSVQELNARSESLAANVAEVATEQLAAREMRRAHHGEIITAMAGLSDGQRNLHAGIDVLNDKADAAATELTAAADRQSTIQRDLRTGNEALASRMTTLAQNQQNLQAGIEDLGDRTQLVSTGLATVAASQDTLRQMQQSHDEAFHARVSQLADHQQALRTQVDTLTATAGQTALSVLTMNNGQAAFQHAMQAGMNGLHERAERSAAGLTGIVEQQAAIHQSVKSGNETLARRTAALAEGQQALKADFGRMATVADRTYADITAVVLAQESLNNTFISHSNEVNTRVARIDETQKAFADNQDILLATAGQTAADILALTNGQANMHQTVKSGNEAVLAQTAKLADNQKALGSHLDVLTATTGQTAADVLALTDGQANMYQAVKSGNEAVLAQTAKLADNQKTLGSHLDVLTATTGQTAADVLTLTSGQDNMHQTIKSGNEAVLAQTAKLADNQKTLGSHLDVLTATTGQTAGDIMALRNGQANMHLAIKSGNEAVLAQTATLADNQKTLGSHLDVLTATTGQTAGNVVALKEGQAGLAQTVQAGLTGLNERATRAADRQQQMQDGLDLLTATTGQTARDVIDMAGRQNALHKAVQNYSQAVDGRMAMLTENQQKMQSGLDTVTATTAQTALDLASLSESQAQREQAGQAGRVELANGLTTIAQDQQNWLQRFDATQARIQAIAEAVATVDQQLAELQGALQHGLHDATALLGTSGRQRQQFESKITQDVQAMIDAIAQLRQTQALLQEQMSQVQKSTQTQADLLKTTLSQMRQPVELQVSDAARKPDRLAMETAE